jgi:hypothetical protein
MEGLFLEESLVSGGGFLGEDFLEGKQYREINRETKYLYLEE